MKYVYVLTSSKSDFYYEQFFLSVVSLRFYNPNAEIVLLVDSDTKKGLTDGRSNYERVVSKVEIISAPRNLSPREISRWLKTSMKEYVMGDFLYIDCDTIVAGILEDNFSSAVKVGAVLDTHVRLPVHHLCPHFQDEDRALGFVSSLKTEVRYNGGLIFCRDKPEADEFFVRWHSLWLESNKKGNHHDMPSLNQADYELQGIIKELDGEWNCQITHNGLPYLYGAKIIHYYATSLTTLVSPYILASEAILREIKETGVISDNIMEQIKNAKTAFEKDSRIIAGKAELDVVNSKFFSLLLRFRKKHERLFKRINDFIIHAVARFGLLK